MTTFRVQMKERHCSHCFQCLFSQPRAGFFFPLFPRGHSRRRCVGFSVSSSGLWLCWLRSVFRVTYLCMLLGILPLPPCHKPDDFTDELFGFDNVKIHSGITGKKRKAYSAMDGANRICVILRSVAVLVALSIPGHILVYAPRNPSLTALPQTR